MVNKNGEQSATTPRNIAAETCAMIRRKPQKRCCHERTAPHPLVHHRSRSQLHLRPLDQDHSRVCEDDGEVADVSVRLILVGGASLLAVDAALDQRLCETCCANYSSGCSERWSNSRKILSTGDVNVSERHLTKSQKTQEC